MPKHIKLCVKVMDMLEKNSFDTQLFFNHSVDGPNINKSFWGKVSQKMVSLRFSGLLLLVMCNFHIVHKAFQYGCTEYGSEVESMAIPLHGCFKIALSYN